MATGNTERFRAARDLLLELREDHDEAYTRFRWPRFETFNWALDWFDPIAQHNSRPALRIVHGHTVASLTYAELSDRSSQVANWLRGRGVARGNRVLVMLDNQLATWEILLAAMKLGAVVIPTYTTISAADLADRIKRGGVTHVITVDVLADRFAGIADHLTRISVGGPVAGWAPYVDACAEPADFTPDGTTHTDDPLFLYFTSGTTSRPKLALHTHTSYPVGHLSSMYWNGVRPGDLHLNISAPGWAKHAWSSFFAPFNAEATLLTVKAGVKGASDVLDALITQRATTFCAPPTVWRMLVQQDLRRRPVALREAGSVGEPLNPEVIDQIRRAWGLTVRDGYGQSETTAQIGNTPGLPVRPGSMGKPLPGYRIVLLDPLTGEPGDEGEICVDLTDRPVGVMPGYLGDPEKNERTFSGGLYHTGDIGRRDDDGYLTYVGRSDDVFKSYDYRISPFELESVLLRHADVAEAAVVPAPDPIGLVIPKAFVTLAAGCPPSAEAARSILRHAQDHLAPHQWIRRLEFGALPKTTSGKIRRAELRASEERTGDTSREYLLDELVGSVGSEPAAPGLGRMDTPSG
ncbi:AMP-binding protein [Kibdelosporangium persicum]|uniref:AMP-dependent synthetase and ligase n=1 Tax=Kibdelosporangium persicum TaxID=2698649 RepID=A0ABX2FG42_9PSEU|nr:AMP-binding protein [Kibdelosporangium persicum]NRN70347.1 AMP-dependent synthetase and ligase [Kibdelosporangium persicum]